ncbi:MAG TPA: Crp/Fnr family transcriptional regulator [Ktedonobacterales bacterium]|nr:Crp/Fnr family transcriptional regulator [Ktedonobacterales bacterium]
MQLVLLKDHQVLHLSGEAIMFVYFPVTAILSVVSVLADGASAEVGLVGSEGMAGLPAFLGATSEPFEVVVQVKGAAYRLPAQFIRDEAHHFDPFQDLLLRYTQAFMSQIAQGIACRGRHTVRQRLARWILMLRDAGESDRIRVTHDFLGQMMGVGRPTVSLAAESIRNDSLIGYNRGVITILDAPGLEGASCECYRLVRDEYNRLLA